MFVVQADRTYWRGEDYDFVGKTIERSIYEEGRARSRPILCKRWISQIITTVVIAEVFARHVAPNVGEAREDEAWQSSH